MEHELIELRKHISSQGILVQDLMTGVCRELEEWKQSNGDNHEAQQDPEISEIQDPLPSERDDEKMIFLEHIDVLLAEHKVEEAIEALDAEEKNSPDLKGSGETSVGEVSQYKSAFLKRKATLEDQLVQIIEQPSVGVQEMKKALYGLIKLGKGPLAHQLLLTSYGLRLQKSIEVLLPSSHVCPKTFSATLSKLVFSIISLTTKESASIFGDNPIYTNRIVQWAEWDIEYFVRLVKENAPSSETVSALRAASICVQASLNYCSMLESQGLKLSKLLLVLLRPYIEEVLELNFRRARRLLFDLVELDESLLFSPHFESLLSAFGTISETIRVDSGMRFMYIVKVAIEGHVGASLSFLNEVLQVEANKPFTKSSHFTSLGWRGGSKSPTGMEMELMAEARTEACRGLYLLRSRGLDLRSGWHWVAMGEGNILLNMDQRAKDKGKAPLIETNSDTSNEDYIGQANDVSMGQRDNCDDTHTDEQDWRTVLGKRLHDLSYADVSRIKFKSIADGDDFYNAYAKFVGFSVRKDDVKRDKNNTVISRRWVCAKEGFRKIKHEETMDRKRDPKPMTRCGCMAAFRMKYDQKSNEWKVVEFASDHNHELASVSDVQFLRSHRKVGESDKAQVQALRSVGVKTSQIMDHLVHQSGGYENVGFTRKDLYNSIDMDRMSKISHGDAEDSQSRLDYAHFGDVLAFDTTYRTNAYKKPLVILVGVNHHMQTTIFGCALLVDETVKTYMWVLKTLIGAMNNKMPMSVVTDGDKAMRAAIEKVLPASQHRLCIWHLERNAQSNLNDKDAVNDFIRCMVSYVSKEEFEDMWSIMIEKHGLHNHEWIREMGAKKSKWAEAYLRGYFFAGCRSTQRCESMNAFLKRFVEVKTRLYELFQHVDRALARIRHNEAISSYESKHSELAIQTQLGMIEKHAVDIFTRTAFLRVRNEIKHEQLLFVVNRLENDGNRTYTISEYQRQSFTWEVKYYPDDQRMQCSCLFFESYGFPCRHLFTIMKAEHLNQIPSTCIMKRWLKTAKSDPPYKHDSQILDDVIRTARFSALSASCSKMCYFGSRTSEGFEELKSEIARLQLRMEVLCNLNTTTTQDIIQDGLNRDKIVRDPIIVKTKGDYGNTSNPNPKVRRCTICKDVGHTRRKCPSLHTQQADVDGDGSDALNEDMV
uniref:SWIM-type domain-containing protein n=1 Tax=Fagus sylvatica TaxID=28930 RepID=A0A2N9GAZ5_FAGSY